MSLLANDNTLSKECYYYKMTRKLYIYVLLNNSMVQKELKTRRKNKMKKNKITYKYAVVKSRKSTSVRKIQAVTKEILKNLKNKIELDKNYNKQTFYTNDKKAIEILKQYDNVFIFADIYNRSYNDFLVVITE